MLIRQLAALTELPEQPQIVSCSALLLFSAKPFAYPLQLVHVGGRDLFLQRRILNHGSVNQNSPVLLFLLPGYIIPFMKLWPMRPPEV